MSKAKCVVCDDAGDAAHFGVESCRACAAFFRRTVALDKSYSCRSNGGCPIQSSVRCMCRACRFAKCLEKGMRPSGVQQRRDCLGRRLQRSPKRGSSSSSLDTPTPIEIPMSPPLSYLEQMPILVRMQDNYQKLEAVRKVIHCREGESIFTERQPRALSYKEANELTVREVNLVADWVVGCFPQLGELPSEQKRLVFKNFYLPFMIMECGFMCSQRGLTDMFILPSGDYIDASRPESYYHDPDNQYRITSEDAAKMFKSSFDIHKRNIVFPFIREKVDAFELFTLCAMILWDQGLENQTEPTAEMARTCRDAILREILFYYSIGRRFEDPAIRLATILVILPALQRSVRRFQEDVEISHVFNVCATSSTFYDIINGKM